MATRKIRRLTILFSAYVVWAASSSLGEKSAVAPSWEEGTKLTLAGHEVQLSKPRLVARRSGFLWFPTLLQFDDKNFAAVMSHASDEANPNPTSLMVRSLDGGLTWSTPTEERPYGESALRLKNGELALLPFSLHYESDDVVSGPKQQWRPDQTMSESEAKGIMVTGWPRKLAPLDADLGGKPEWQMGSFFFNGQTIATNDGKTDLAFLYGRFAGIKRYSLVVAESTDGANWKIRSIVADESCALPGAEGASESSVVRLKDGRLYCVFRMSSSAPYGESFSSDEGKTWSVPQNVNGLLMSVQPSLAISGKGVVALSGGRPWINTWINFAGDAKAWERVDLVTHHNTFQPNEPITAWDAAAAASSTCYTEIRWLDDRHFLVIYDRLANGWHAPTPGSSETNSIWVVRGTVD